MEQTFIHRDIETVINEAARYFSVITITGPRQSGKTTLIKNIFPDLPYYTLENLDVRGFAMSDPIAFISQNENGAIFDEVQNVPELLSYLQGVVDEHPEKRFVLSGSSNFSMLKSITQSLAGRTAIFELLPMSLSEVIDMAKDKSLDNVLYDGFYPAIYSGRNIPKFIYPAYIKTYLERDIRDLLKVKDLMTFNIFLRLCASRIGSVFNASELANELGVSTNTVRSWLSVLQTSYIVTLLPPYYDNSRKRLIKAPKIYFCDTGLACALLGIDSAEVLARDKMRGHLFENFIVAEAMKHYFNKGKECNMYFYRDSNQNEIDLLLQNNDGLTAIEIKSSMTYHPDFEKVLRKADEWVNMPIKKKCVVYAGDLESTDSEIMKINYKHLDNIWNL